MKTSSYSFKIGDFNCWIINDGKVPVPDVLQDPDHKNNIISLDTLVLLVKTRTNTVLVDTGWGPGAEAAPQAGLLTQDLEAEGIRREDFDSIIFSHAHIDHIGGNIDSYGNPVFPNAKYYMFRKEWEFWTTGPDLSSMPESIRESAQLAVQKNLIPLKDNINLFDDSRDIVPGISCMAAPGHSPGHIILIVSSGYQRLICLFDSFHRPIEIEKPSLFLTPPMTDEAKSSRDKILSLITKDDLIYAGHFPFPGLGHILLQNNICHWQPIVTN
ncbi:MAG: MBL fold metallo-hydrolase [Dehalococcoidales bacterium]|nr:MBL fold metallo-hydrolase [Dehalococcoidales bacterium]